MIRHHLIHPSRYTPDQICDLVADVEMYPVFIPWIKSLRTWDYSERADFKTFSAEVVVGYRMLRETFRTKVEVDQKHHRVTATLIKGPFRNLQAVWHMTPKGTGSDIDFLIEVDIKIPFLKKLLEEKLNVASERLLHCFEQRALALYGLSASA